MKTKIHNLFLFLFLPYLSQAQFLDIKAILCPIGIENEMPLSVGMGIEYSIVPSHSIDFQYGRVSYRRLGRYGIGGNVKQGAEYSLNYRFYLLDNKMPKTQLFFSLGLIYSDLRWDNYEDDIGCKKIRDDQDEIGGSLRIGMKLLGRRLFFEPSVALRISHYKKISERICDTPLPDTYYKNENIGKTKSYFLGIGVGYRFNVRKKG